MLWFCFSFLFTSLLHFFLPLFLSFCFWLSSWLHACLDSKKLHTPHRRRSQGFRYCPGPLQLKPSSENVPLPVLTPKEEESMDVEPYPNSQWIAANRKPFLGAFRDTCPPECLHASTLEPPKPEMRGTKSTLKNLRHSGFRSSSNT